MRHMIFALTVAFFVAILTSTASAEETAYSWYDDVGIYLAHDVDHHFYEAEMNFGEKDWKGAADEIEKARALLELEALRADGKEYDALEEAVSDLDDLANDVEDDNVHSSSKLRDVFAEANHALAMHHYMKASEAWKNKDYATTLRALEISQEHLKRAIIWHKHKQKKMAPKHSKDK